MREIKNIVGALTEKSNLKRAVATQMKEQGIANLLGDFTKTPKGEYVYHLADADGKPVYLRLSVSVSVDENIFADPVEKAKAVDAGDEIEVNIFD